MKITKENFHEVEGKGIREEGMEKTSAFFPIFLTTNNVMHGKDELGYHCEYDLEDETLNWEFYTEPKKKVKLYPALLKFCDEYVISTSVFASKEEAERKCGRYTFISWPVESICVEVEE